MRKREPARLYGHGLSAVCERCGEKFGRHGAAVPHTIGPSPSDPGCDGFRRTRPHPPLEHPK